ncbi:MAG: hypothetical protein ACFNXU_04730 [Kingella sp. (in: b-proteobacteria)]
MATPATDFRHLPAGEMMQAFIVPVQDENGKSTFQIENTVLYGNKAGILVEIKLESEKVSKTEKYRQFTNLAQSLLHQFI